MATKQLAPGEKPEEGHQAITVLKPFVFSRKRPERVGLADLQPRAEHLVPGRFQVEDEVANHPWIKDHFADGRIESPAQAAARDQEAQKKKAAAKENAERLLADARAVFARSARAGSVKVGGGTPAAGPDPAELERLANTPIGELQRRQAAGGKGARRGAPKGAKAADGATADEKTGESAGDDAGDQGGEQQ